MLLNLSNLLTLLRIIITPFVVFAILNNSFLTALLLFGLGAFTDFLDGFFARIYGLNTELGAYLDPVADKIFLLSTIGALVIKLKFFPLWFFIMILIREFIIVSGALYVKYRSPEFIVRPSIWGKLNTVLIMAYILSRLFSKTGLVLYFNIQFNSYLDILFYSIIFFSLYSLIHYVKIGVKHLHK